MELLDGGVGFAQKVTDFSLERLHFPFADQIELLSEEDKLFQGGIGMGYGFQLVETAWNGIFRFLETIFQNR